VTTGPDEVINEDLYVFGTNALIQGTVHGDVVSFARRVDIPGNVDGDVLAAAGDINVSGQVRGSIRAAAGTLVVAGQVGEDALLAAGEVRLEPRARVGRDAFLASSTADLQAPVGGDIRAAVDKLTLAAPVSGDVHAEVGTLRVTDKAQVTGSLTYRSAKGAEIDSGATVTGPVQRLSAEPRRGPTPLLYVLGWLRSLVGLFALGLLLVLITPDFARRVPVTLRQKPWQSLGWGAVALVGAPILAGLLFAVGMLLGGWWIGLLALGLFALAVALCFPVVGMFIGRWLLERLGKAGTPIVLALLLGLALLTLVDRVPILGALIVLATILFGLGALVLTAAQGRRPPRGPARLQPS
jgi:cytoskeletal protein CcmA (bactofilin family)